MRCTARCVLHIVVTVAVGIVLADHLGRGGHLDGGYDLFGEKIKASAFAVLKWNEDWNRAFDRNC